MPSNQVHINGQENLSWEVSDSKMEALVSVLDGIGSRVFTGSHQEALDQARKDHDKAWNEEQA